MSSVIVSLLFVSVGVSHGYVVSPIQRRKTLSLRQAAIRSRISQATNMKMGLVDEVIDFADQRMELEKLFEKERSITTAPISVDEAEAQHGMPWKASIASNVQLKDGEDLLYMPFWKWQMSFIKESLTNLKVESCSHEDIDFSYVENTEKKARMVSLCLSSDEYRKIRMTYYDAGDNAQVFNSVCYPDPKYDLPVLGVDLLAFNRKKYLSIVDFQPLHEDENNHATAFENLLSPIKDKYHTLKGRMSSKFYDETKFFSKQMLFARFENEGVVEDELYPAFQQYVTTHLGLIHNTLPNESDVDVVMERQKAYDTYSAERDPATGLFTAMFGGQWAQSFVHNFLFSMSQRASNKADAAESSAPLGPSRGGATFVPQAVQQRHESQAFTSPTQR